MSIPVPLDRLRDAIAERGDAAYLLTVADDGSPHVVHVPVRWDGDALTVNVGKRTAANAAARPLAVSLLYPVRTPDDYSLIVNGTAAVADDDARRLLITAATAVLHRPAAVPDPAAACGADCVPLLAPASRKRS